MPTPFSPAMDPYIERTGIWETCHAALIAAISDQLNERLPRGYVATIEERLRLMPPEDVDTPAATPAPRPQDRQPDVAVTGRGRVLGEGDGGSVATLEAVEVEMKEPLAEVRDTFAEVLRMPEREVVTVIEVLSPANKAGRSRREYLFKRQQVRGQGASVLEIDLLLNGQRLMTGPAMTPPGEGYCAVLIRDGVLRRAYVYNWPAADPLPTLPVPLREPDADVALELRPLVDQVYDRGRYADLLRYDGQIKPPAAAAKS